MLFLVSCPKGQVEKYVNVEACGDICASRIDIGPPGDICTRSTEIGPPGDIDGYGGVLIEINGTPGDMNLGSTENSEPQLMATKAYLIRVYHILPLFVLYSFRHFEIFSNMCLVECSGWKLKKKTIHRISIKVFFKILIRLLNRNIGNTGHPDLLDFTPLLLFD